VLSIDFRADISTQYDYLSHSILSLAASHLAMVSTSNIPRRALSHRVSAINGLNKALSSTPRNRADVDAILAACYALAMQALYTGENVAEFLTMFRGCHIVISQQWPNRLGSQFQRLDSHCQLHMASSKISVLPVIDSTFVKPAEESLHRLEPLCKDGLEKTVHGLLLDVVQALLVSSREGCHPILDTESMEFIIC
jgi:hypothetical protein